MIELCKQQITRSMIIGLKYCDQHITYLMKMSDSIYKIFTSSIFYVTHIKSNIGTAKEHANPGDEGTSNRGEIRKMNSNLTFRVYN